MKTKIKLAILSSIQNLDGKGYGGELRRAISETLNAYVSYAPMYVKLKRLESEGLISSSLGVAIPNRNHQPRRYYKITEAGIAALNESSFK